MQNTEIKCEFCGKPLIPRILEYKGQPFRAGYILCGCDKAKKEHKRREAYDKAILEERKRKGLYSRSGISEYWQKHCTPNDKYLPILKAGKGLYIDGKIGSGKTFLAVSILMACLQKRMTGKFTSMREVTRELRSTWNGEGSESNVFKRLMHPQVLILDDLGKENMTESVMRDLFDLVDMRKDAMRPLIVTSNYTKPELVARMAQGGDSTTAESIVSRLFEMTEPVHVQGEDRRLA